MSTVHWDTDALLQSCWRRYPTSYTYGIPTSELTSLVSHPPPALLKARATGRPDAFNDTLEL